MQDARFGQHDEAWRRAGFGPFQQPAGGADEIGQIEQVLLAFGMGDHFGIGMLLLEPQQRLFAEAFVHDAAAWP